MRIRHVSSLLAAAAAVPFALAACSAAPDAEVDAELVATAAQADKVASGWDVRAGFGPNAGAQVDLDGDGRADLPVQDQTEGIAIFSLGADGALRAPWVANGMDTGGWRVGTADLPPVAIGDFDGDGHRDLLTSSAWGVGVLSELGGAIRTRWGAPRGTAVGDRVIDDTFWTNVSGDYVSAGKRGLLWAGPKGLDVVHLSTTGSLSLASRLAYGTTMMGGYTFDHSTGVAGQGDYYGTGQTFLALVNTQGIAIVATTEKDTWVPLNDIRWGSWAGGWHFGPDDRVKESADFDGDGADDLLVRSPWGIVVLRLKDHLFDVPEVIAGAPWTSFVPGAVDFDPVGAVADFDGDRRADFVYVGADNTLYLVTADVAAHSFKTIATLPVGTSLPGGFTYDHKSAWFLNNNRTHGTFALASRHSMFAENGVGQAAFFGLDETGHFRSWGTTHMTGAAVPPPACGASGQTCCSGSTCNSGLTCQGGTCAVPPPPPTCGASGKACCAGNTCNAGLTCQAGTCASPPACTKHSYTFCTFTNVTVSGSGCTEAEAQTDAYKKNGSLQHKGPCNLPCGGAGVAEVWRCCPSDPHKEAYLGYGCTFDQARRNAELNDIGCSAWVDGQTCM
jgi:hypothetical protein